MKHAETTIQCRHCRKMFTLKKDTHVCPKCIAELRKEKPARR